MALVVIYCNDLTVIVLKMYKAAAVLSVLMKVYNIPCRDRGHINVMLVLQSCTDCLQVPQGSSSELFPTSSDCTYEVTLQSCTDTLQVPQDSSSEIFPTSSDGTYEVALQICTDTLQVPQGSSSEIFPTSSDGTYDVSNTEVEEDVHVKEEGFLIYK